MKRNLVLVQPALGDMDQFRDKPTPPLGLLCAASVICREMEVRLIDQRVDKDWRNGLARALDDGTVAVGVTSMTGGPIAGAVKAAEEAKSLRAVPVILGGIHASLLPAQAAAHHLIDYVVEGEGETALAELVRAIAAGAGAGAVPGVWSRISGRSQGTARGPLLSMDDLPPVPYQLVDMERYTQTWRGERMFFYQSSRGCPHHCTYCYNRSFNSGRWRPRSAANVLNDLRGLRERFGFSMVYFLDDNFFIDQRRAMEILAGLKDLGLGSLLQGVDTETLTHLSDSDLDFIEAAGVQRLSIGIESGADRLRSEVLKKHGSLDLARRQLERFRKRKIIIFASLMVGLPSETGEETEKTIQLAMEILAMGPNFRMPQLYNFVPYPGTELFRILKENGEHFPERLEGWGVYEFDRSHLRHDQPETADFLERVIFLSKFLDAKLDDYACSSAILRTIYNMYRPLAWARLRTGFLRPLPERCVYHLLKDLLA